MKNILNNLDNLLFKNRLSRKDRYNFPISDAKYYRRSLEKAQKAIINNGQIILGSGVKTFEKNFSKWINDKLDAEQLLAVGSGTDALELALRSINISHGDLVAIPSHTAYATAASILRIGAQPVFIDINTNNYTLCPESLNNILIKTSNIKTVIAVHLYGGSCEIDKIYEICLKFNIP